MKTDYTIEIGGNKFSLVLPRPPRCAGLTNIYYSQTELERPALAFTVFGLCAPSGTLPEYFPDSEMSWEDYGNQVYDAMERMQPDASFMELHALIKPFVDGVIGRVFPSAVAIKAQEDFSEAGTGDPAPTSQASASPETGKAAPPAGGS